MTKEIHIKEIGIVRITKKKSVRRLTLSVKPFGGIVVTIPYSMSFEKALRFVNEKKDWILKSQKKISKIEEKRTKYTPKSVFKTKEHELVFKLSKINQLTITSSKIIVRYANESVFEKDSFQDNIRYAIVEALRMEAKIFLPQRTEYLANKHSFKYNKVTVRNAKTRWGSCSGVNNISLNIHLMRLPNHLIDYIILHELCHTIEKNHGQKFWKLLDKVSGNAKGLDKEVNSYSTIIF